MEKKVLLFSGGFDSQLQEWLIKPDVLLYVDMKTSYSERELEVLNNLDKYYTDRLVIKELPIGEYERDNKYLPYRNLILGTIAMEYGQHVYFGFNYNDTAPDKDKMFLDKTTSLFKHLNVNCKVDMNWSTGNFSFNAPFLHLTKTQMVAECLKKGMPAEHIQGIRSCYSGYSKKGCGICGPCLSRAVALLNNNIYKEGLFDEEITVEKLEKRFLYAQENPYNFKKKYLFDIQKAIKNLRLLQK